MAQVHILTLCLDDYNKFNMLNNIIGASAKRDRGTFISVWNTTNTSSGSSNSNQIKLPLTNGGVYNFSVDWGDGSTSVITSWNQTETTHTYSVSGTKTLTIKGVINGFRFANTADKLKIISVSKWGCFRLSANGATFDGCANLTLDAVEDILNLSGTTTLNSTFRNCVSLTTINNISFWYVAHILTMNSAFAGCTSFNSSFSNWNTPLVTDFNGFLYLCTAFDQDISNLSFESCNTASIFMVGKNYTNYSPIYYGNLLIAMAGQTFINSGWTINFGGLKSSASNVAVQTARTSLITAPKSLVLTDGGLII